MKRLYLRIYLAVVASILLAVALAGVAWYFIADPRSTMRRAANSSPPWRKPCCRPCQRVRRSRSRAWNVCKSSAASISSCSMRGTG